MFGESSPDNSDARLWLRMTSPVNFHLFNRGALGIFCGRHCSDLLLKKSSPNQVSPWPVFNLGCGEGQTGCFPTVLQCYIAEKNKPDVYLFAKQYLRLFSSSTNRIMELREVRV